MNKKPIDAQCSEASADRVCGEPIEAALLASRACGEARAPQTGAETGLVRISEAPAEATACGAPTPPAACKAGAETGLVRISEAPAEGTACGAPTPPAACKAGAETGLVRISEAPAEGTACGEPTPPAARKASETPEDEPKDPPGVEAPDTAAARVPARASAGGPSEIPRRVPGASPRAARAEPIEARDEAKAAPRGKTRQRPVLRLDSPDFSCDHVRVREVRGKEAIGRLFSFDIEVVCADGAELAVAEVLGATAQLVFEVEGAEERTVHGMIAEVEDRHETQSDFRSYRLRLVPRAFRSTLVELQQVFLNISVPRLIQQKLAMVGLEADDVVMRLCRDYPVREMIVQYKETDLTFISRLAEHLGISFFFEHESGRDVMVFTDEQVGFGPLPRGDTALFRPWGERHDIFAIREQARLFPATYIMQEYNYRTPKLDLTVTHESTAGLGGGVVEYGAHYKTPEEGRRLAQVRAEERASSNLYFECESDELRLIPGAHFELEGPPRLDRSRFLVVEVEHHAVQPVAIQGGAGGEQEYFNRARLVRAEQTYRPPRATPRPRIYGVVTALVEPLPSGEIGKVSPIEEQGRYTVRFYFDAGDAASRTFPSRLVRMIQPHAGPNYGFHFPLKPGVEVQMVFLDGDPDRPLIVGSVPNPITPSPVTREENLTHRIETSTGIRIEMKDCPPRA